MKKITPLLLFITLLFIPLAIHAQEDRTDLAHVEVALWPDFDDPSMLVLITGTMPEDAELPADVTVPLLDGYSRLVVARITDDGNMVDDLELLETTNSVTFSSPEPRFRIEYYAPYTADDDQRQLDFSWESPNLDVDTFQVTVQRPAAATEMTIVPEAVGEVVAQNTGLTEYLLPAQPIPAGTMYEVSVNYGVNSRLLSRDLINDSSLPVADDNGGGAGETAVSEPNSAAENNDTLVLIFGIIGILLITIAATWYIATSRSSNKTPSKPRPNRSKKKRSKAVIFCHECGSSLTTKAAFCASCGTAVKFNKR